MLLWPLLAMPTPNHLTPQQAMHIESIESITSKCNYNLRTQLSRGTLLPLGRLLQPHQDNRSRGALLPLGCLLHPQKHNRNHSRAA